MRIEFEGEPSEFAGCDGIAVEARADGHPFVCVISHEALAEAARSLRLGVRRNPEVFRRSRDRFRQALAAKLGKAGDTPAATRITWEDVRSAAR